MTAINPIVKLEILKDYMNYWIKVWPKNHLTFDRFLLNRHPELIAGTPEYYREIATHCYYCDQHMKPDGKHAPTIDHYLPLSLGETDIFVICCFTCNNLKSNTHPKKFTEMIAQANLKGREVFGLSGNKLKTAFQRTQIIVSESLYNIETKIYYIKKWLPSKTQPHVTPRSALNPAHDKNRMRNSIDKNNSKYLSPVPG